MASHPTAAAAEIRAKAGELGFDAVGIASAEPGPQDAARLREFLAAGHHGTMAWLASRTAERANPKVLWPEARSVISLGLSYAPEHDPLDNIGRRERGTISVYARGRDYHVLLKGKLKHLAQHIVSRHGGAVKVFVDTAPVSEKPAAQRAGLGWQGKHTNLVSRSHGSWLFLGEVFSTLELPADVLHADRCGTCRRCLNACPTDAFPAPYRLDATRCISYLTLEHVGPIPEALRPLMGNRIAGCDDCLAVCPWNRFAQAGRHIALAERKALASPRLAELAMLDDAGFRALFSASPVKRIGRSRFARNVAIAVGNSGDKGLLPAAARLAADADPVVAEAGAWAQGRIG
jgi:epoxyqueuosine reductase